RGEDAADDFQERALSRAVGADQAQRVRLLEVEAHVTKSPEVLHDGLPEADHALFQRHVVVQAEALGDVDCPDCGAHYSSWAKLPWARAKKRCASHTSKREATKTPRSCSEHRNPGSRHLQAL